MNSIDLLKSKNIGFKIVELASEPRSANDVERLYGCPLKQVLKTLVFVGENPVIVVLQGDKRINLEKLKQLTNESDLRMAKPDEVKEITTYSVGGVTPFGVSGVKIIIDSKVFEEEVVNIGSGEAITGIELKSNDLMQVLDAQVEEISE